jgi:O-antigen ligase
MLPYLARQAALGDPDYRAFKGTLRLYLWGVGLCTLLLSLFLLLLGRPLVALLFQRGAFSAADTLATATILAGFAPGLLPMASSFLLSRAFNALGETRVPMYLALVNVGANALLDALFVRFWQGLGIALATSAVSLITSLLLLAFLYRRIGTLRVWHVPLEMHAVAARLKPPRWAQRAVSRKSWLEYDFSAGSRQESWLERCFSASSKRQGLLSMGVMLVALVFGAFATARNAVGTLQVSAGGLLVLCFLRYPFVLLLAWASLDVGIGSSLVMLNGNHLDLVLLLPLLCLLPALPWREMSGRVPGLRWLALYLVWVLLGIGLSPLDVRAFLTLWLTMLASAGAGVLTIALVTTRRHLVGLSNALLATALLVALYGLYGFATHQQGEMDPDTSLFRVTSLFTQATTFAFYLSPLIPLAFYRYLYAQGAFRLAGLAVMLCLLGALLLTFTRSAYVSTFLGIVIMALCLPSRRGRLLLVSGWLCAGGAAFYLGWSGNLPLLARFFKTDTATFNGRLYLWQALLRNFQVTRWLGSGLQSSDQLLAYLHVGTAGQGVIGTAPHSLFLGTLYDHGIIGLLLLSFFLLSLGWRLLQGITGSSGERRMLYAAALASLVSVLVQSLGSRDLWIQAAGVPFWIVVALPFARYWPENAAPTSDESRQRDSRSRWGCSLLSGFLLFCRIHTYVKGEV